MIIYLDGAFLPKEEAKVSVASDGPGAKRQHR